MQPVFFNPEADDAVNYGSMGAVIGHELTHGFDDQGAQYDADGNLKNWWTKEDLQRFKAKTDKLVKQFDNYVAIDDVHVKGALTLGENIADLGGLTIAYYALKKSLEGKPAPAKIDGFTAEQRFFIAWAQAWRVNMRPAFLKNMIQTNPHSPGNFRANAAPSNMQEFYDAFDVKPGDKMYRPKEERAEIW
jgi:putative endopeptidase